MCSLFGFNLNAAMYLALQGCQGSPLLLLRSGSQVGEVRKPCRLATFLLLPSLPCDTSCPTHVQPLQSTSHSKEEAPGELQSKMAQLLDWSCTQNFCTTAFSEDMQLAQLVPVDRQPL